MQLIFRWPANLSTQPSVSRKQRRKLAVHYFFLRLSRSFANFKRPPSRFHMVSENQEYWNHHDGLSNSEINLFSRMKISVTINSLKEKEKVYMFICLYEHIIREVKLHGQVKRQTPRDQVSHFLVVYCSLFKHINQQFHPTFYPKNFFEQFLSAHFLF